MQNENKTSVENKICGRLWDIVNDFMLEKINFPMDCVKSLLNILYNGFSEASENKPVNIMDYMAVVIAAQKELQDVFTAIEKLENDIMSLSKELR